MSNNLCRKVEKAPGGPSEACYAQQSKIQVHTETKYFFCAQKVDFIKSQSTTQNRC